MRRHDGGRVRPDRRRKERPFGSTLVLCIAALAVAAATASARVGGLDPDGGRRADGASPTRAASRARDPRNVPTSGRGDAPAGSPAEALTGSVGVISNGTVRLGVNPQGHLDVVADDGDEVGLEYLPTGGDALVPGCWCEGWGVMDQRSGLSGWASVANGGVSRNLSVSSFDVTADTAESVVVVDGRLRVTHRYRPSARPELYRVELRVENLGPAPARVVYRRAMDWDVPPTEFAELVTIQGSHPMLLDSTDDGFALVDPLQPLTDLGARGTFTDVGPDDRGSAFDFLLGELAPGAGTSLTMFYGAAASEAAALDALAAVDADLYSLGQPSTPGGPTEGTPNTFMFGVSDGAVADGPVIAQGRLVVPPPGNPVEGDPAAVSGSVGLYLPSRSTSAPSEDLLVASATTEPDGTFVLRSGSTAPLAAAAELNDGKVNLNLVANANGYTYHESLIREYRAGGWTDDDGAIPADVVAQPLTSVANPRLVPGSSGGATTGSTSYVRCATTREPLESKRAWTTIGELHTPIDTNRAVFAYGERADSYISKAVSVDGSVWLLKGMAKLGKDVTSSNSAVISVDVGYDRWAREIQTEFVYTKFRLELVCASTIPVVAEHYEIRPTDWVGSIRTGADLRYLDDRCYQDHFEFMAQYGRDGGFDRSSERYGTFVGAASVSFAGVTVALNARSGLSRWVRVTWDFGNRTSKHILCGTDDMPIRSSRIFAGA